MYQYYKYGFVVLLLTMAAWAIASCRAPATVDVPLEFQPTEPATEPPFVPTPLPPMEETIIVCLKDEPASLFIYHPDVQSGESSAEARTILQAVYDGPIDLVGYQPQAVILESLPTISNGGATIRTSTIAENEVYFNPEALQPRNLHIGDPYLPQGCNAPECIRTYTGGDVEMDQLVVQFTLLDGLTWSDGQPLTAADSRFSYLLDRRGDLPTTKFLVDRTVAYDVQDERTVEWVGIPGFMDSDFQTNFWTPLPEHLMGELTGSELLESETVNRFPIGWGAYLIADWQPGEMTLQPNPNYAFNEANEPNLDRLIFRFIKEQGDGALQQIQTDECDLVDESLLAPADYRTAADLQERGDMKVWSSPDGRMIRLDFILDTVGRGRLDYFSDSDMRKTVARCIDRSAIQSVFGVEGDPLPATYHAGGSRFSSPELDSIQFEPEEAQARLDEIGWVLDNDHPESPRVAFGVPGVSTGTPFAVSLVTAQTDEFIMIAELIADDLEACGLSVEVTAVPADELGAPWPDGIAFGRGHDLVLWAWPEWITPLCEMFASWEIPTSAQPYGVNASGYRSVEYDAACKQLLLSIPGMQVFEEASLTTQRLFNSDLPAVPLFRPRRWAASEIELCGLSPDSLATSLLWNVEMLDSGDACP